MPDSEEKEITLKEIIISAVLLGIAIIDNKVHIFGGIASLGDAARLSLFSIPYSLSPILCMVSYILCGKSVVLSAVRNILKGKVFDEKFLMTAASLGAAALGEISEAAAVMLLYQIGEYFEDKAEDRSRRSIETLMEIRADTACVKRDGKEIIVSADDVRVGESIVIRTGERVPLDCTVIFGRSFLDMASLTGESVPVMVMPGSHILSGAINCNAQSGGGGVIEAVADKAAGESAAARIIELVSQSAEKKAKSEKFITAFSRIYTPIVCALSLILAAVPSIITRDPYTWVSRALIFLVISCPCALVISVPLSFAAGLGRASRLGILIKGAQYIEMLSRAKIAVFDKTGTLTRGTFLVTAVNPQDPSKIGAEELVALAAHAETYSNHPVSRSIRNAHSCPRCNLVNIEDAREIPGKGICTIIDGVKVLAGNSTLMKENRVAGFDNLGGCPQAAKQPQSEKAAPAAADNHLTLATAVVHVAVDGVYAGNIEISDETKTGAASAVQQLKSLGIKRVIMLTGDSDEAAESVAREVGADEVHSNLLPQDKVKEVEKLLDELRTSRGARRFFPSMLPMAKSKSMGTAPAFAPCNKRGTLLFAGDGINDAPVLTLADIGVAMGALGSDAAVEAADAVIMTDELEKISDAVRVSKNTMSIVRQNIAFAIGVKMLIMVLGALGLANMPLAVFGDTGVALLATFNALRAAYNGRKSA